MLRNVKSARLPLEHAGEGIPSVFGRERIMKEWTGRTQPVEGGVAAQRGATAAATGDLEAAAGDAPIRRAAEREVEGLRPSAPGIELVLAFFVPEDVADGHLGVAGSGGLT